MRSLAIGGVIACAVVAAFAACGDSSSDGAAVPTEAGLDAPLFVETGGPDAEPEPDPGDPCGDRSGLQASAPWPVSGGCPKRAGFADVIGPRTAAKQAEIPMAGPSAPVIDASRTVWVGTSDGTIVAVPPSFTRSSVAVGGAVTGAPALNAAGVAIVGAADGTMYGVVRRIALPDAGADADAGAGAEAGTDAGPPAFVPTIILTQAIGASASSPVIGPDGTIYVTVTDAVVARGQDGGAKWKTPLAGVASSSPALDADVLYVGSSDGHLYAVGTIGDVKWAYDAGAPIASSPSIGGDGTIYVGSTDGNVHAIDRAGARKWTYATGGAISGLATYRGTVWASSADKKLHAIATRTGKAKWTFETLGPVAPPVVDKEGSVYFGSGDGKVYVLTPGGSLFFAVNAKGAVTTAPALTDGMLWVTTANGLVGVGP